MVAPNGHNSLPKKGPNMSVVLVPPNFWCRGFALHQKCGWYHFSHIFSIFSIFEFFQKHIRASPGLTSFSANSRGARLFNIFNGVSYPRVRYSMFNRMSYPRVRHSLLMSSLEIKNVQLSQSAEISQEDNLYFHLSDRTMVFPRKMPFCLR